jgi:hypothetical protein
MASTSKTVDQKLSEMISMMTAGVERFAELEKEYLQMAETFDAYMHDEEMNGEVRCEAAYEAKKQRELARDMHRRASDFAMFIELYEKFYKK